MEINLRKVPIREMNLSGEVEFDSSFYEKTGILGISKVEYSCHIYRDSNQEDFLSLDGKGCFFLEDARTLEPVEYPFTIHLEEKIDFDSEFCGRFLENSQNTLDILSILWENIVLEIPISFTISEELEETKEKEGEEKDIDPRLAPLRVLLEKEKE